MKFQFIDYSIISIYFLFVIGIGFMLKRRIKTGNDFLMSNRSIPLWITSLAFISANPGAQEVLGMAADGAKYGISTAHFYWIGAALAMVFLGIYMMPFYYSSKARSVPYGIQKNNLWINLWNTLKHITRKGLNHLNGPTIQVSLLIKRTIH